MHKHITASITQRGQVTIPAEVMRLIGVTPRGKVVFEIDGEHVYVARPAFTVETLAGSVAPIREPADLDEQISQAKEEHAARKKLKLGEL